MQQNSRSFPGLPPILLCVHNTSEGRFIAHGFGDASDGPENIDAEFQPITAPASELPATSPGARFLGGSPQRRPLISKQTPPFLYPLSTTLNCSSTTSKPSKYIRYSYKAHHPAKMKVATILTFAAVALADIINNEVRPPQTPWSNSSNWVSSTSKLKSHLPLNANARRSPATRSTCTTAAPSRRTAASSMLAITAGNLSAS